jgi:hypothetical protein
MTTTVRPIVLFFILIAITSTGGQAQATQTGSDNALNEPVLDSKVAQFDLTDSTLIEGLSKLSSAPIAGLHLGIEEILQEKSSDSRDQSVRLSLRLENRTVRNIVEMLCQFDNRYTWSTDGRSINVYPRQIIDSRPYFLNRELEHITLKDMLGPEQALTPLARLLPGEQVGYAGIGGDHSYPAPWSTVFNNLTVRQLMNRISEHTGPRGGWILSGSTDQRFFFFFKSGFHHEDRTEK